MPYMKEVVTLKHEVNIHLADGKVLKSVLQGTIMCMCQGRRITLEALVVPKLKHNLLSASKVVSGLKMVFEKDLATICTKNFAVVCKKVSGFYWK